MFTFVTFTSTAFEELVVPLKKEGVQAVGDFVLYLDFGILVGVGMLDVDAFAGIVESVAVSVALVYFDTGVDS